MGYDEQMIEAVFDKLGGDEGVRRFLAGDLVVKPQSEFNIFQTLELGTEFKTIDALRKVIQDRGMRIGGLANDILNSLTMAIKKIKLDLVVVSVAELGFRIKTTCEQIYARAEERGLGLCPAGVGPQLRLNYEYQPNGEWLVVTIEPAINSDGNLQLFYVMRRPSGLWLHGYCDNPNILWLPETRFVFSLNS